MSTEWINPFRYPVMAAALLLTALPAADAGAVDAVAVDVGDPMPAEQAARSMQVPEGFHVTLFAGEPDVQQPIGFCIDDRGRLWVAEAYNYPNHTTQPGDRIVILEDSDGDGRFDRRTVFYDQLNYVTGIEVGFGGVWVMSPPNFYFIPDRDADDRPDGPPEVLLDGFGTHANAHNLANGFAWGPDGWLYGTHGRTNWSMIGRPGEPDDRRVRFDGGVYRYHPVRHVWEPYADGTTNPWGIDWNDVGEAFVCNCVNPHLFHVIPGAHYEPWRNRESSQYAYERIPTIADHLHFVGTDKVTDGLGTPEEDAAGGGHAHCGTMVYLGDNWPDRYRNTLFTNNIHGRRINNDILHRAGSGYTASHGEDLMRSRDDWFMGVTLAYGPAGEVYASDWSDTGECHSVRNTQRQTGRIYRITYGQVTRPSVDLSRRSNAELVQLQLHRNDWFVRHARRLLQQRAAAGHPMQQVHQQLHAQYQQQQDVPRKLRLLWSLHVTGGLSHDFLMTQLDHPDPSLRSWALRLLCEDGSPSAEALQRFQDLARNDRSPLVRLHLASVLQRIDRRDRWAVAGELLTHAEDRDDDNLPLMYWYAIEPLVHEDLTRLVGLVAQTRLPLVRRHIARRVAELDDRQTGLALLVDALHMASDRPATQADLLSGILRGLEGSRSVPMPANWPAVYQRLAAAADGDVAAQATRLALIFDDPAALRLLTLQAADTRRDAVDRVLAIEALAARRPDQLAPLLLSLIGDPATQRSALRALANYDAPDTAEAIMAAYPSMDRQGRQTALQTLASRPAWARVLLDALQTQRVDRSDITAFTARQIDSLGDAQLSERLGRLWGQMRATPAERVKQIAALKKQLSAPSSADHDLAAGQQVFAKHCGNCHRMFGQGADIGPDLSGAQRTNLDYLLENIIDPSASVSKDYQMEVVQTVDGRVITGLLTAQSDRSLTLTTATEKIVVPLDEIESRQPSSVSMMPDGLLSPLSRDEIRNLFGYLRGASQPESLGGLRVSNEREAKP